MWTLNQSLGQEGTGGSGIDEVLDLGLSLLEDEGVRRRAGCHGGGQPLYQFFDQEHGAQQFLAYRPKRSW